MKILHIVPLISDDAAFGGPARGTARQSVALDKLGHDSSILALWRGAGERPSDVMGVKAQLFKFWKLPGHRFATALSPSALYWLLRNKNHFDVIHVHAGRDLWILIAMIIMRFTNSSYVLQTHGMLAPRTGVVFRAYDALLTRPAVRGAKSLLYLTPYEQRDLLEVSPQSHTTHIVNGVDDIRSDVPNVVEQGHTRKLVFVSRIHPRKRLTDLVSALSLARHDSDVSLDIYGPDEGDLENVLARISQLDLQMSVNYLGALQYSDVRRKLTEYDVMVLPSVKEPFPNIVLESLAAGVPVLITDSCGLAPYILDNQAGVVVSPGAESLAGGIRKLANDEELRKLVAKNGQRLARDLFTMEGVATGLVAAYKGEDK